MGNLKCRISQKRLIIERNGRKFGTRGTTLHICRILLMPDPLSLVWHHSVHFAKFPIPWFLKHYSFNSFHQISTKLHTKYHNQGLIIRLILFWRSAWKFQNVSPPTVFIWCQPYFMRTLATMVEYRLSLYLTISQVLKKLCYFEILTWESVGKPKMSNISKTANRRAKWTKMWDSGTTVQICKVLLMPDSLSLVWADSVHFAKFLILQFLKLSSSLKFLSLHPNFAQGIIIVQAVPFFFGDLPKIAKIMAFWNFS